MPTFLRTLIVLAVATRVVGAQDPRPGADLPTDGKGPLSTTTHGLVLIPVVQSTPALGTGLGGVAAYEFRLDSSPTSAAGVGGVYTTSHSWMFGAGGRVWFHNARREGVLGTSIFNANYDFFGIGYSAGRAGNSVPIRQRGDAILLQFFGELPGKVYIGPEYLYRSVTTSLHRGFESNALAVVVNQDNDYHISALGGALEYDSRDDHDAPHHGNESRAALRFAEGWLGSNESYTGFDAAINQYFALTHRQVLATRFAACGVGANAPIWEYCLYGTNSDLRGYEGGRYRDRSMFAWQAELRTPVAGPLGAALFGGIGGVANSMSAYTWNQLLPAGGFGLRYLAFAKGNVTLGADYAWGRDGGAFYLRVGEAF